MRELKAGLIAGLILAVLNAASAWFFSFKKSLITFFAFKYLPVDWLLVGVWIGIPVGVVLLNEKRPARLWIYTVAGGCAALTTFVCQVFEFALTRYAWDLETFVRFVGLHGKMYGYGGGYIWVSALISASFAGSYAHAVVVSKTTKKWRLPPPNWVLPSCRLLIQVGLASGQLSRQHREFIRALMERQSFWKVRELAEDFDAALNDCISAEKAGAYETGFADLLGHDGFASEDRRVWLFDQLCALVRQEPEPGSAQLGKLRQIGEAWQLAVPDDLALKTVGNEAAPSVAPVKWEKWRRKHLRSAGDAPGFYFAFSGLSIVLAIFIAYAALMSELSIPAESELEHVTGTVAHLISGESSVTISLFAVNESFELNSKVDAVDEVKSAVGVLTEIALAVDPKPSSPRAIYGIRVGDHVIKSYAEIRDAIQEDNSWALVLCPLFILLGWGFFSAGTLTRNRRAGIRFFAWQGGAGVPKNTG